MKTNYKLGLEIHSQLLENRVETPFSVGNRPDASIIKDSFSDIVSELGLDLENDSLQDTPKRVAEMYVNEIFKGLDYRNFPKCTTVNNEFNADEMILVRGISVLSFCEHHFLPFHGTAKIAYIPRNSIIGLSKFNRIVDFFASRPQIQERLTSQIFIALKHILNTENIAVEIDCVHHCVKSRGIRDCNSSTNTTKLGGSFHSSAATRSEFFSK